MRGRYGFLTILLGSLMALLLHGQVWAASSIDKFSAAIRLQPDGSVAVQQDITYTQASLLDWTLYTNARNLSVTADGQSLASKSVTVRHKGSTSLLHGKKLANHWQLNYTVTSALLRHNDRDQIFLRLFQNPGAPVNDINVIFLLPEYTGEAKLDGNAYSLGGSIGAATQIASQNQIIYHADYGAAGSLFTVNASWSKDVLRLSQAQELRLSISNLESAPWIALGILLPLICLIIFWRLLARQKKYERPVTTVLSTPPSAQRPITVGILVNKKIYPPEIAALIIELCQRGYVVIIKKLGKYYLARRKPLDEHLLEWERAIIEQLFLSNSQVDIKTLAAETGERIYSPEIKKAFSAIYTQVAQTHYFVENPHFTRVKNKLIGLAFYFLGAVGLLTVAIVGASPYLLIPLSGTMLLAFLIIRLSPKLVHYTVEGKQARDQWLAFANYLGEEKPLPLEATRDQTFEKFLAYAVVLGKTKEWGRRFDLTSITIVAPDWFISYESASTTEFIAEIYQFTDSLSEIITALRGPLVS